MRTATLTKWALLAVALATLAACAVAREPRGAREAHRLGLLSGSRAAYERAAAQQEAVAQVAVAVQGQAQQARLDLRDVRVPEDMAVVDMRLKAIGDLAGMARQVSGEPVTAPPEPTALPAAQVKHWSRVKQTVERAVAKDRDAGTSPWVAPSMVSARLQDVAAAEGAKDERASIRAEQGWLYYGVWALTHWHYVLVVGAVILLAFAALWIASIFMPALGPVVSILGAFLRLAGNATAAMATGGATLAGHALGWLQQRMTAKALAQTVDGVQNVKDTLASENAVLRQKINTLLMAKQDTDVQAHIDALKDK